MKIFSLFSSVFIDANETIEKAPNHVNVFINSSENLMPFRACVCAQIHSLFSGSCSKRYFSIASNVTSDRTCSMRQQSSSAISSGTPR